MSAVSNLDKKEKIRRRAVTLLVRNGPRPLEMFSILLLSAGINLMTSAIVTSSLEFGWLFSSICLTIAGSIVFSMASVVGPSYEDAKDQQRAQLTQLEQGKRDQKVDSLSARTTDIVLFGNKGQDKRRIFYKAIYVGILLLVGLVIPVYKTFQAATNRNPAVQSMSDVDGSQRNRQIEKSDPSESPMETPKSAATPSSDGPE